MFDRIFPRTLREACRFGAVVTLSVQAATLVVLMVVMSPACNPFLSDRCDLQSWFVAVLHIAASAGIGALAGIALYGLLWRIDRRRSLRAQDDT